MRASEEEELHGESSDSGSGFKVFGRSATESVRESVAPREAVATEPPRTAADDPFATLSEDTSAEDAGVKPTAPAAPQPEVPSYDKSAPRPAPVSHEVLEADFPFTAPRGARPSVEHRAAASRRPLPPVASQAVPHAPARQVATSAGVRTPAEPAAPRPVHDSGSAAESERPDWYRDPAFWVHVIPLAGTALILTGFGLVPGLLIENTAGRRDDFVRDQAREAINFQLNYLLLNLAALITFTAPVVWPLSLAFGIVLPIQAALDVKNGKRHRYPLVPRWLDGA